MPTHPQARTILELRWMRTSVIARWVVRPAEWRQTRSSISRNMNCGQMGPGRLLAPPIGAAIAAAQTLTADRSAAALVRGAEDGAAFPGARNGRGATHVRLAVSHSRHPTRSCVARFGTRSDNPSLSSTTTSGVCRLTVRGGGHVRAEDPANCEGYGLCSMQSTALLRGAHRLQTTALAGGRSNVEPLWFPHTYTYASR